MPSPTFMIVWAREEIEEIEKLLKDETLTDRDIETMQTTIAKLRQVIAVAEEDISRPPKKAGSG